MYIHQNKSNFDCARPERGHNSLQGVQSDQHKHNLYCRGPQEKPTEGTD